MRTDRISRPDNWPLLPGDPGWPKSLRLDPAGPILADAVITLVHNRGRKPLDNAGAALQALVDLINAGRASIPDAVANARAQYYSWDHIATVIGIDPDIAERRYRRYCDTGRWFDPDND
jgi:hypothetical protein